MTLQLHDELVFEVSSSHLPRIAAMVKRDMEGVAGVWGIQLPMSVKLSVGPSWGQLTRYEVPDMQEELEQQQQP